MMKRLSVLLLSVLCGLLLAGCAPRRSTDLSGILVDGKAPGADFASLDLSRYHESDRYTGKQTYRFEELVLDERNGAVCYLFARMDEGVAVTVKGEQPTTLTQLTELLGEGYTDDSYDREQQLRARRYADAERGVTAEFVYSRLDETLLWVTLEQTT